MTGFVFERDLPHQNAAVSGVMRALNGISVETTQTGTRNPRLMFEGMSQSLQANLLALKKEGDWSQDFKIDANNLSELILDISMETGTGNTRLSRSEWKKMRAELLRRQGSERDALKKKQAEDWGFAKAELAARRKADKKVFLAEHAHQKQIARERNRPVWRDLFERQRQEAAACRIEVEKAVKDHRKAHSFLGRVLSILPFRQSAAEAQAKLAIKRMELGQLLADQELEKRRLRRQLAEQVFDLTVEALPERRPLDLTGMKERHAEDWQALRKQQREEREAAGIRSERLAREKAEHEKEKTRNRRASIKEREARMREGLSEESTRELEEQRQQRERENDRDRERDR